MWPKTVVSCVLLTLTLSFDVKSAGLENFEVLDRECRKIEPASAKIERCKKLVGSSLLDEEFKDVPYFDIAWTYYELKDIDHAIAYAKLYVEGRKKYHRNFDTGIRCKEFKGIAFEVCLRSPSAQVGYAYEWVARYETHKALTLLLARDYAASVQITHSAIANLTSAIHYDRDSHSAYAERAELLAKLCKQDEARADYSIAIAVALRRGQDRDAQEYRDKLSWISGSCQKEFKER